MVSKVGIHHLPVIKLCQVFVSCAAFLCFSRLYNSIFMILRCEFLIQSRGQEYISNIQDAHFHLGETVVRAFIPLICSE